MTKLIAYAQDFVSFLIQKIGTEKFDEIILYGSVARLNADSKSDVDIFINTKKKIDVSSIIDGFYRSVKYARYWRLLGIKNHFNVIVGDLNKWDLKRSIISDGIILYSKYKEAPKGSGYSLFIVDILGKRKDQIKLWRKLYGYSQKVGNKKYTTNGEIKKNNGKKISPSTFIVPLNKSHIMQRFLRENKINYKIIEFWTDSIV